VTDNEGATNSNTSLVAAAGSCSSSCTASTMNIDSVVANTLRGSKGKSYGEVLVTITDNCDNPVPDATVTGTFTGDFTGTVDEITLDNGVAVIITEEVKKPSYTPEETASTVTPQSDEGVISPSTIVEMSAYTSRVEETDSSPCISADGSNICEYDGCVVASNDYAFGTVIDVEGFGLCEVRDRMNSRYTSTGNMDIYFGMDLDGALKFGRQKVEIKVIS
jgi:hypothetical protein